MGETSEGGTLWAAYQAAMAVASLVAVAFGVATAPRLPPAATYLVVVYAGIVAVILGRMWYRRRMALPVARGEEVVDDEASDDLADGADATGGAPESTVVGESGRPGTSGD